jgi:Alpha-glutamyl/putrescinyl thymine pyrophosphorylase clade 2
MSKHKLTEVMEFGAWLIQTEDLDPIYCALYRAKLPVKQMYRLLLAYWCFYHLGVSAFISQFDGEAFWSMMANAASDKLPPTYYGGVGERWPRGAERRHFRGWVCEQAVKALHGDHKEPYPADYLVQSLAAACYSKPIELATVMGWVQQKPLFGPWIAFKAADMLERILGAQIEFPVDLALIYKEPRAALGMLEIPAERASLQLLQYFYEFKAPPSGNRNCNIQEVETVLCKWKSSVGGHYWVGKDIHEVRHGLKGWGKTADKLLRCMPKEVERGLFR